MKSLRESLFDKDLIQKDMDVTVLISILDGSIKSNKRISNDDWRKCLDKISKYTNYDSSSKVKFKKRNIDLDPNILYFNIDHSTLIILGNIFDQSDNLSQLITINWKPEGDGFLLATVWSQLDSVYASLVRMQDYKALNTTPSLNKTLEDVLRDKTHII